MSIAHILMGVLIAAIWGSNFVAIKICCQTFTPFTLVLVRFILTVFPLIFFIPFPKTPLKQIIGLALFMWIGQFVPVFFAIHNGMPAGLSSLLMQSHVIFTTILVVVLYKVHINKLHIFGLILSTIGMGWIALQTGQSGMLEGYALILLAAINTSVGNLLMKTSHEENLLSLVCWSTLFAILPMALITAYHEGLHLIWDQILSVDLAAGLSICYTSYISTLVGFGAWGYLIRHYPASSVAPFTLLVPIFGMGSCAIFMHETVTMGNMMASGVVVSGLVINYVSKIQERRQRLRLQRQNSLR